MRGVLRVHLTPAQRKAESRRKMAIWHLHNNARNIAMGLTGSGRPRSARQKPRALSPELQRMVAIYKRKLARSAQPKELPPLEAAWRSFRESVVLPEQGVGNEPEGATNLV